MRINKIFSPYLEDEDVMCAVNRFELQQSKAPNERTTPTSSREKESFLESSRLCVCVSEWVNRRRPRNGPIEEEEVKRIKMDDDALYKIGMKQ